MPFRQIRDVPEELYETARKRRLEILKELKEGTATEPPLQLLPAAENLVRADRER